MGITEKFTVKQGGQKFYFYLWNPSSRLHIQNNLSLQVVLYQLNNILI
jgi:hypothetical protein